MLHVLHKHLFRLSYVTCNTMVTLSSIGTYRLMRHNICNYVSPVTIPPPLRRSSTLTIMLKNTPKTEQKHSGVNKNQNLAIVLCSRSQGIQDTIPRVLVILSLSSNFMVTKTSASL